MKTTIAIVSLTILQAAFFAITYYQEPTDWFAAYYFSWVLIPAIVAAISFAPRWHFTAAISNAVLSTLLFDYLFLQHGYFWPEQPQESQNLAVGYVVLGAGLAFIIAGFLHAIIRRLDRQGSTERLARTLTATRKGFVFSSICAIVAFPLCTMFGPAVAGVTPNPTYLFAAIVATCLISIGTIISIVVGLSYNPTQFQSTERGITNG